MAGQQEVVIGDSFDIAIHLHNKHNAQLFSTEEAHWEQNGRAFNASVDQLFSQHGAVLAGYWMPFDPTTAEADKATMMARFPGDMKWEDIKIPVGSDVRMKMLGQFEEALEGKLAPYFTGGAGAGPFMDGREEPMYADFVVGGWLQFMRGCLPEWEMLRNEWSGGRWGRLMDALEEWAVVDGREGIHPAKS